MSRRAGHPRGHPPLLGVHEAALYVRDLERAERFWTRLGLERVGKATGRHVFFRVGDDLLLLFDPRGTVAGGRVPGHGAIGPGHAAFSVPDRASIEVWRRLLADADVDVEHEVSWPNGGQSLYFRDPDGNSLEVITSGSWGFPEP